MRRTRQLSCAPLTSRRHLCSSAVGAAESPLAENSSATTDFRTNRRRNSMRRTRQLSCAPLTSRRHLCSSAVVAAKSPLPLHFPPSFPSPVACVDQLGQTHRLTSLPTTRSLPPLRRQPTGWTSSARSPVPNAALRSQPVALPNHLGCPKISPVPPCRGKAALLWLKWLGQAKSYPWTSLGIDTRLVLQRCVDRLLVLSLISITV